MRKASTNSSKTRHRAARPSTLRQGIAQTAELAKHRRRAADLIGPLTVPTLDGVAVTAVLPAEGLVRLRDVLKVYPVSEALWWQGIREGRYPPPIKLGVQLRAWRVRDIRRLLAAAEDGELPKVWPPAPSREAARAEFSS